MDPDACWARMTELADEISGNGVKLESIADYEYPAELADELVEQTRDLRDWMDKGGFPPVTFTTASGSLRREHVTVLAAQHVLGYFETNAQGAMVAGSYVNALIFALACADQINRTKLALVEPALASAVNEYKERLDGAAFLRAKAVQAG